MSSKRSKQPRKKRDREIWDLHRVLDLSKRRKEKCDSKDCGAIAVAYWKSTHGNHWNTCESCQLKDFGGWPEGVSIDSKKQKCVFLSLPLYKVSKKKKKIAKTKDLNTKQEETDVQDKAIRNDLPEGVLGLKQAPNQPLARQEKSIPPKSNVKVAPYNRPSKPSIQIGSLPKDGNKRELATIEFQERKISKERISQGWSKRQSLYSIPSMCKAKTVSLKSMKYDLRRGGTLTIYPNLVSDTTTRKVKEELFSCGLFRQYQIQAQDEPRLHFLLHSKATEDFEASAQPGYRYASVRMKARPLKILPELNRLSAELAKECNIEDDWSIGVNPVLYRDQLDGMGGHADDDQEEEIILCVIVASPESARRVVITPKKTKSCLEEGDERIELFLLPGDAYEMDGEMQKYYIHSVPKDKENKKQESSTRVVVVFRTGKRVLLSNDTGRSCEDLSPRPPKIQIFGKTIEGLKEGHVYTRPMLYQMNAHYMQQRGVSGNITNGCDAIIVSGLREDKLGEDALFTLMYAVEKKKGGASVVTSFEKKLPVRIFRSSGYNHPFRAHSPSGQTGKKTKTWYRYDGLYIVVSYEKPTVLKGPYKFQLKRVEQGEGVFLNDIPNANFSTHCQALGTLVRTDGNLNETMYPAEKENSFTCNGPDVLNPRLPLV